MVTGLSARMTLSRDLFSLDVDLAVPPRKTVALVGPNGAGKSTIVSAIGGLLAIDSGRIALDEVIFDEPGTGSFLPPEQRHLGIVFQDQLLFPHLSALDNVAFGLAARGVNAAGASSRARQALADVGLEGKVGSRPQSLSGGERQLVALARALVFEPAMLLLDEPLSALDVEARPEVRRLMTRHLQSFEGPRLVITHDPTEAFLLGDTIAIVEEGQIVQVGAPEEIRMAPRTPYVGRLTGTNLVAGEARNGVIEVDDHRVVVSDTESVGNVVLSIPAAAISVHRDRPAGSPRNAWRTRVDQVESTGTTVRVRTGSPLPLTVEVTEAARQELGLVDGAEVWVAIKATEIGVQEL